MQVEDLESKAARLMDALTLENNFFIGALPDEKLHQKVCLLIEVEEVIKALEQAALTDYFGPYEVPKRIIYLPRFVYTPTGKINRSATLQLVDILS